jgi:hypothetical protein
VSFIEVVIEPKQEGKGRSFRAICMASSRADKLWDGGGAAGDIERPVFAAFVGSDAELRPFVANLMLGRRALVAGNYGRRAKGFEFLKSAGYKYIWQREGEGSIVSVFLPELFLMDPGMVDPKVAKFVLLPSSRWAAEQAIDTGPIVRYVKRTPLVKKLNAGPPADDWRWRQKDYVHEPLFSDDVLAALVPTAYLFAAFLDRRTRAPLLADGRFYLQLMMACLGAGLASLSVDSYGGYHGPKFGRSGSTGFVETNTAAAGFLPGVAFNAGHEAIETLLAQEIAIYFQLTRGKHG